MAFIKNNNKFTCFEIMDNNPERPHYPISQGGITVHRAHWDFPEYKTPREYSGKPVKPGIQKITKKGFYMDYMLKIAKEIPSSTQYKSQNFWSSPKKSLNKLDLKVRRMSYIDDIQLSAKRKKSTPGVGVYKLIPSQKQIENQNKKLMIMSSRRLSAPKRFFYQDVQYISNAQPGPGNYNPHEIKHKETMNRTQPNFWKNKHSQQMKKKITTGKSKPDPALYKPNFYGTFDYFNKSTEGKKSSARPWGSATRFRHYEKQVKKNPNQQKTPTPVTYDMSITWKGKATKASQSSDKKRDWLHATSRPRAQSIYH